MVHLKIPRPAFLIILTAILTLTVQSLTAADPAWVKSYGTDTPYPRDTYLTGYASVSRDEPSSRAQARDLALADLSGKIRTRVQSELLQIASESDGDYNSSVSQITRNSVDITITGADFSYHENRRDSYALAYVPLQTLARNFTGEASAFWEEILEARENAETLSTSGNTGRALAVLYRAAALFPGIYEHYTIIRSLGVSGGESGFFRSLSGVNALTDLQRTESEINTLIEKLSNRDASNISEAAEMITVIMNMQQVHPLPSSQCSAASTGKKGTESGSSFWPPTPQEKKKAEPKYCSPPPPPEAVH